MKKKKWQEQGITLIALVVTIILLLILAGVSISSLTGENGIIGNAVKANFYTEMGSLDETKDMEKTIGVLSQYMGYNAENSFLEKNLSSSEAKNLSNTLKAEIIFTRNNYGGGEQLDTKRMWKNNFFDCQDIWNDDDLVAGIINDLYYIKESNSIKGQTYIYDQVTDKCYKIKDTSINSKVVHSLAYAKLMLDGVNSNGIGTAEDDSTTFKSSDGTIAYEPNVNNLSYKTEMVYYSSTFEEKTVSLKEYLSEGKKKNITVDGKEYRLADYVENGTNIYANIKCTANGLESYWVWIPRYAYKLDASVEKQEKSNIIFVDTNDKPLDTKKYGENLPEGYTVHAAFKQKEGLKGIWFSKYEPSPMETIEIDSTEPGKPNLSNFNKSDTKLIYYTLDGKKYIEKQYTEEPENKITENGTDYYFYNYENKIWANVKCTSNNLESWWVWIPRYAYKLESGQSTTILVDENDAPIDKEKYGNKLPEGFTVHAAFSQGDGLKGIWFSKYEPTATELGKVDNTEPKTPNLTNFDASSTSLIYYTQDGKNKIEVPYSENPAQKITESGTDYYFYNYTNKIWANVKCSGNNLISYWVWIPRYAYKLESGQASVIFVDSNNKPLDTEKFGDTLPDGYTLHSAFKQDDGLDGIWFSKYEPSKVEEGN